MARPHKLPEATRRQGGQLAFTISVETDVDVEDMTYLVYIAHTHNDEWMPVTREEVWHLVRKYTRQGYHKPCDWHEDEYLLYKNRILILFPELR